MQRERAHRVRGWRITLIMFSTVAFAVVGIILLKISMGRASGYEISIHAMKSPPIMEFVGVGCLVIAALSYTLLLRFVPLYVGQLVASVQFGAIVLAGTLVLGETLSILAWAGIGLIGIGIALMGAVSDGDEPPRMSK